MPGNRLFYLLISTTVNATTSTKKNIFIWQGNWQGGAENITLEMAQYLHKRHANVTIGVFKKNTSSPLKQIVFNVPDLIPFSFKSLYASIIYQLNYVNNFSAVYAHTLGLWKTKNNSLFIHEAADLDNYLAKSNNLLHHFSAWLWKTTYLNFCLKKASIIFTATKETHDYMARHDISQNKLRPSSSFYNETIFTYIKRKPPTSQIKIIFIGNYLDPRKQFNTLRKYFYDKPKFTVSILGGPAKPNDKNFKYLGYHDSSCVKQTLADSHIFILPSLSEGFSIALLEALATGIPCIANREAVNHELRNINSLLAYEQPDQLPRLVKEIIKNYAHYNTPNKRLNRFSRAIVLQNEYRQISKHLSL